MIRIILLLTAVTFGQTVTTRWENENIRFEHTSGVTVKEITAAADSFENQRAFEITTPVDANKIYLSIGSGVSVMDASLNISSLNSWWVADAFRMSSPGNGSAPRVNVWRFQDSLFYMHDFTKSDTSNYVRFAYSDISWDLLSRFAYGESCNQYFYSFHFTLPITLNVTARMNAMTDIMTGVDFINRNRGGFAHGTTKTIAAKPLSKIGLAQKKAEAFDLLGRQPSNSPRSLLIFRR